MTTRTTLAASLCAAITLATPALSQEAQTFRLPDRCGAAMPGMAQSDTHDSMADHGAEMESADDHGAMPDHVQQNLDRMLMTMPAMRSGMMQADPDIAFACGMIAHHQAAIDMAEVVLDHGRDPEMRRLAEQILDVQAKEIEIMTRWLENAPD